MGGEGCVVIIYIKPMAGVWCWWIPRIPHAALGCPFGTPTPRELFRDGIFCFRNGQELGPELWSARRNRLGDVSVGFWGWVDSRLRICTFQTHFGPEVAGGMLWGGSWPQGWQGHNRDFWPRMLGEGLVISRGGGRTTSMCSLVQGFLCFCSWPLPLVALFYPPHQIHRWDPPLLLQAEQAQLLQDLLNNSKL